MKDIYTDLGKFVTKTFPDAKSHEHLLQLKKETQEAIDSPNDIEEIADCLICILGAAYKRGYTYDMVMNSINIKMAINKRRTWKKLSDGTYRHIEE